MSIISKERLEQLASGNAWVCVQDDEAAELARIVLASLEAEPDYYVVVTSVGVWQSFCKTRAEAEFIVSKPFNPGYSIREIYTAPPAPVVPEEINVLQAANLVLMLGVLDNGIPTVAMKVWNACRAAMIQGAEPVTTANKLPEETGSSLQLRNLIRQRHAEWSQSTFGDVGPVGPLKHLSKEALEAAAEPDDLSEWADMQFLLWDAQRRAGICDGEITSAMEEKLKVNMARQWPEPNDGEPRQHIKAAPQQEVKP